MSSIIRLQNNKEQKLNKHNLHILKWICYDIYNVMNVTAQKETKGFILPWIRPMTCFSVAHIYKITFVLMNCNQLKQNSLNKKST